MGLCIRSNVEVFLKFDDQLPIVLSSFVTVVLFQAVDGTARNLGNQSVLVGKLLA